MMGAVEKQLGDGEEVKGADQRAFNSTGLGKSGVEASRARLCVTR